MKEPPPRVIFIGLNGRDLAYTRVRCYTFARILNGVGIPTGVFTLQEAYHPGTDPDYMLRLPASRRLLLTSRTFARLWRERGALLYIQKTHYHAAAPFLLSRMGRNRFILDYDDWDMDRSFFHGMPAVDRRIFGDSRIEGITERLARAAAVCVASTEPLRNFLSRYSDRVRLIPTVADTDRFAPPSSRGGPTTFIWTGMVWGKVIFDNVMFLVDCFSVVHGEMPGSRLVIAGKGDWLPRLRREIEDRHEGLPVEVRGWVPPDEMPSLLAEADIGLMPLIPDSGNEEWMRCKCPTKLFEFMAMGMPSVVSDFGETGRVVDHGGDGFTALGRNDFVGKMLRLARDRALRERMGKAARGRAVERYSLASQAEALRGVVSEASNLNYSSRVGGMNNSG